MFVGNHIELLVKLLVLSISVEGDSENPRVQNFSKMLENKIEKEIEFYFHIQSLL